VMRITESIFMHLIRSLRVSKPKRSEISRGRNVWSCARFAFSIAIMYGKLLVLDNA